MSTYLGYKRYNNQITFEDKATKSEVQERKEKLASDVEAFLAAGGKVTKCEPVPEDFNRKSCGAIQ